MSFMSDYEKRMLKNIEENKKVLASLGLNKPFFNFQKKPATKQGVKRKRSEDEKPRKAQRSSADSLQTRELVQSSEDDWLSKYGRRRSGRLMGKEPGDVKGLDFELEDEEEEKPKRTPTRNRENVFGPIPGIKVGTTWSTRLACSGDGVHRPTVAGIHGNAVEGCYSLALSGGYEDDLDYGDCFTYTGEGGRDLKGTKANPKNLRTAPQSKDQTLTRGNLALTQNIEKGRPVRVIRGYKLDSPFAPEEGYRYDGIYSVEKYWKAVGMSGFMVYKFALKRCDNQPPPVWHNSAENEQEDTNEGRAVEGDAEGSEKENNTSSRKSPLADKSGEDSMTNLLDGKPSENGAKKNSIQGNSKIQDEKNNVDVDAVSNGSDEESSVKTKPHDDRNDSANDNDKDDTGHDVDDSLAPANDDDDDDDDDDAAVNDDNITANVGDAAAAAAKHIAANNKDDDDDDDDAVNADGDDDDDHVTNTAGHQGSKGATRTNE